MIWEFLWASLFSEKISSKYSISVILFYLIKSWINQLSFIILLVLTEVFFNLKDMWLLKFVEVDSVCHQMYVHYEKSEAYCPAIEPFLKVIFRERVGHIIKRFWSYYWQYIVMIWIKLNFGYVFCFL